MDFDAYLSGGFNFGTLMNSSNVLMIKLMDQFEMCGVNELYIMWDTVMSSWADLCSMIVNVAIMIGVGWENEDTAPFIVLELWKDGWKRNDWAEIGKGFLLLMSQAVKYDAPDLQI